MDENAEVEEAGSLVEPRVGFSEDSIVGETESLAVTRPRSMRSRDAGDECVESTEIMESSRDGNVPGRWMTDGWTD